jgi:hypothetical protein
MGLLNSIEHWLDTSLEVANDSVDRIDEIEDKVWEQRVVDEATQHGIADAAEDWENGTANTLDYGGHNLTDAYADLGAEMPGDTEIHLPDTINPFLAALEVAFTPTSLGGEEQWQQGRELYIDAHHDAYREEAINQFDQELEERIGPDPSAWQSPADFFPSSMDNYPQSSSDTSSSVDPDHSSNSPFSSDP